jgi:hypothetical protein
LQRREYILGFSAYGASVKLTGGKTELRSAGNQYLVGRGELVGRDRTLLYGDTELRGDLLARLSGGEGLGKLIRAAVAGENVADLAAEVSEVSDALKSELAAEIKNGLEIRPTKNVQSGFRLAAKDGSGYFDCSDDGIMEMLMPYFRNLDFQ